MLSDAPAKGVLLVGVDPLLDVANPQAAAAALKQADMVVGLTSHRTDALLDLADVLLPMAPFTETSGSFVNAEGTLQSFVGVVPAQGEARPGWKVLRVLGNSLGLSGFEFESSEQVRAGLKLDVQQATPAGLQALAGTAEPALVRLNELPVYASDMLVRQAESLQATRDGRDAATVQLPQGLWAQLNLNDGELVRVAQGQGHALLPAKLHPGLAEGVVRVAGGLAATATLGAGFGAITVEKARNDRPTLCLGRAAPRGLLAGGLEPDEDHRGGGAADALRGLPDALGTQGHRPFAAAPGSEPGRPLRLADADR